MSQSEVRAALIERLLAIHGDAGICPSADDWTAIFALEGKGSVELLNLLRFRREVATPEGPISGAEAYRKYASRVAGAFARAGGERIFFGRVGHMFSFGHADHWDAAVLTRYPSPRALAEMWLDPEFIAAHRNRVDGVERSQVLVFGRPAEAGLL